MSHDGNTDLTPRHPCSGTSAFHSQSIISGQNFSVSSIPPLQASTTHVFDQDDLSGAQQMLRDQDRSQSVFRVPACVANHMRVAEINAVSRGGIDASVHAGHDEIFLRRWKRQVALVESGSVLLVLGNEILLDVGRHICCGISVCVRRSFQNGYQ